MENVMVLLCEVLFVQVVLMMASGVVLLPHLPPRVTVRKA